MNQNLLGNVDNLLALSAQLATILFAVYTAILTLVTIYRRGFIYAVIQLISFRILIPALLVASLGLASLAVIFVEPTNVAVIISIISPGGVRATPYTAGFRLIVPLLEDAEEYPIYWQTYTMSSEPQEGAVFGDDSIRARTNDGQEVFLDVSIVFRIDAAQAVLVHIDWQNRYIEDFVRPVLQGYVRREVSQFSVDEVNSSARADLEEALDRQFREEFASKGFIVDQFLLRDITFSPEYAQSVEDKQVAEQQEEQAVFEAERERELARGQADAIELVAEGQANAITIEAAAEATAFTLIGRSVAENPEVLTYQYIDRLSPSIQTLLVPNDAPFILPLDGLIPDEPNPPLTPTPFVPTISPSPTPVPDTTSEGQ